LARACRHRPWRNDRKRRAPRATGRPSRRRWRLDRTRRASGSVCTATTTSSGLSPGGGGGGGAGTAASAGGGGGAGAGAGSGGGAVSAFAGGGAASGGAAGAASAAGASLPSVTIWRVVVPELVSAAVWPAASGDAAPGFNSILRGGSLSAATAREAEGYDCDAGKNSGPSGHGESPLARHCCQDIRDQKSEIGNQRS
jgi:hypothetical protein